MLLKKFEDLEKRVYKLEQQIMYDKSSKKDDHLIKAKNNLINIHKDLYKIMFSEILTKEDLYKNKKETILLIKDVELFYNQYIGICGMLIRNNSENNDLNK